MCFWRNTCHLQMIPNIQLKMFNVQYSIYYKIQNARVFFRNEIKTEIEMEMEMALDRSWRDWQGELWVDGYKVKYEIWKCFSAYNMFYILFSLYAIFLYYRFSCYVLLTVYTRLLLQIIIITRRTRTSSSSRRRRE